MWLGGWPRQCVDRLGPRHQLDHPIRRRNVPHDFYDDGDNVLTGFENVIFTALNLTNGRWDWFSNLTSTVPVANGTKVTSNGGFHFEVDAL